MEYGEVFPAVYPGTGTVVVRYVAGYGEESSDVPEALKLALRQSVVTVYDMSRATHIGSASEARQLPLSGRRLFDKYRVLSFGHG